MKATWNNQILAQSGKTIVIENNHYFPPSSVNIKFFDKSTTTSTCLWKGDATYYNIKVGNEINSDAAWFYPEPKSAAKEIKNYVAFWKGIIIDE